MDEFSPEPLRLENPSKFWTIDVPRRFGPLLAALALAGLAFSLFAMKDPANPGTLVALIVQGAVVAGLVAVALQAARRGQVESIEFSDRFRFYDRGHPIAFDWNQVTGLWYEGVRNPARVKVTSANPSAAEDRVLIVGVLGGSEIRLRVSPPQQPPILDWARFIERKFVANP